MNSEVPNPALDRHRKRLAAFVARARRVESHSLLSDLEQFHAWAQGTITVGPIDGVMHMTQDVPAEEAFESLASRCRPFVLQGDPIHWASVFGSLRAFLKSDQQFGPAVESLRTSWGQAVQPKPGTGFAALRPNQAESDGVWFGTLANSWLYGDLVHADPAAQQDAAGHSLNSRYSAAVMFYGQVTIHAIATLNLIRQAQDANLLHLDNEVFLQPVAAKVPMQFPVTGIAKGPAGTPAQQLIDALDGAKASAHEPSILAEDTSDLAASDETPGKGAAEHTSGSSNETAD